MRNIYYHLWLKGAATDSQAKKLLEKHGSHINIYKCEDYSEDEFLSKKSVDKLLDKDLSCAKKICEECKEKGIEILTPSSRYYPRKLKKQKLPPPVLYAIGDITRINKVPTIGVVGTRRMTEYGREMTEKFSREIVKSGISVVTGFAMGVDTVATKTATEEDSYVICVLGGGVDYIYPPTNKELYKRVLENGVFLSEYPPSTRPHPSFFPSRNRIIAALSDTVLVTEAPEKSGAIITARHARSQKKPVYTIPGQINKTINAGTNMLLKKGAIPAFTPEDIIKKYKKATYTPDTLEITPICDNPVLSALHQRDMNIDELCMTLGITIGECNSMCFILELGGKIKKLPGNFYHKI